MKAMSVPEQGSVEVRNGGGAGETRVDGDDLGPVFLGPGHPTEGHGMVLGGVAADDHDQIGVTDVDPVVGHGAAAEARGQARDGELAGLVVDVDDTQGPGEFGQGHALLVVQHSAAEIGDAHGAVDRHAGPVGAHERLVAHLLDELGHLLHGPLIGLLFPLGSAGAR